MINQRYKILKVLGEGRSKVYLARDEDNSGQLVALKVLGNNISGQELISFREEYNTLRKLDHPNIIKVFDYGTVLKNTQSDFDVAPGCKYFTEEFVEAIGLNVYESAAAEEILRRIVKQLASILYYLHLNNFIYYDLKPENILIHIVDDKPIVKLIDLGLARYLHSAAEYTIRGTAEYIAPELLNNQPHDHRVDLYSLGIMIYYIIYKNFPFDTTDQLSIYKAHSEKEFEFPENQYSPSLNQTLKKLLSKDPAKRFANALQVIESLDMIVSDDLTRHFLSAKHFVDRVDSLEKIKDYISSSTRGSVLLIKGFEGSGKTTLLQEIENIYDNVILIHRRQSLSGVQLLQSILKKIYFSDYIFSKLSDSTRGLAENFLSGSSSNVITDFKSVITRIATESRFNLFIDDFNLFDTFSLEIFKEIIPVFQLNDIKLILSENPELGNQTDYIQKLIELNLNPFTSEQLEEYITKTFISSFPKEPVKDLIIADADLLPGNFVSFIKDLNLLRILKFTGSGIEFDIDEKKSALLKNTGNEIFRERTSLLSDEELLLAKYLASFTNSPSGKLLSRLLNIEEEKLSYILEQLEIKNIIQPIHITNEPVFTSASLKKYIYNLIGAKNKFHAFIANTIRHSFFDYDRKEFARHYEMAGLFKESYQVLKREIAEAESMFAYGYKKSLCEHVLKFSLDDSTLKHIKLEIAKTNQLIGDYNSALTIVEAIKSEENDSLTQLEIDILNGTCLVSAGETENGLEILKSSLDHIKDKSQKYKVKTEIASAMLSLNRFEETQNLCKELIGNESVKLEDKAKCYNLLALSSFYSTNNIAESLEFFSEAHRLYKQINQPARVAAIENNMGNLFLMKGDSAAAEKHWNSALEINKSVGNLEQEALQLMNFGVYYFDKSENEKAETLYKRAQEIFASLGNRSGEGMALTNLGEVYTAECEYQQALNVLLEAVEVLSGQQNTSELSEAVLMLGKLYFIIGDEESLKEIIKKSESIQNQENLSIKVKENHDYLKQLLLISSGEFEEPIKFFEKLSEKYLLDQDYRNFSKVNTFLVELLLKTNQKEKILSFLNKEEFVKSCESDILMEAERNFLLGKAAVNFPQDNSKSFIDYFEIAYGAIEKLSITELTWKVLLALSDAYYLRGNFKKCVEFINYTKALLMFIAENIEDENLKKCYIKKPERFEAFEKLKYLEEKTR
ncbi:MAG: protein kinase [Ignavibacteriaceae bacterium]|nr:protein kinase [Ignavibacteriaceae bacterium]